MNPPITSELSLYQLTQSLACPPPSLTVKASTLRTWVETLIQFLIQQKIEATIWAKLPNNLTWLSPLESYQQEGLAQSIYLCSIGNNHKTSPGKSSISVTDSLSNTGIISIVLEASSQLKREYFCLIISPQLCSLILAQEKSSSSAQESPSGQLQSSLLKLVYSFDLQIIEPIFTAIKQGISITDTTPAELLTDSVLPFRLPSAIDGSLLTQLWYAYLNANLLSSELSTPEKSSTKESSALVSSVALNEDFLNALARELSTPLTNIKTALRLLESMQHKREPRQRYINLIKGECDRQNSLINGLQDLAQLNHRVEKTDSCVKLEDLVPGIVSTYQPIAEEQGIRLGYTIAAGLPPVACPSAWLRQILRNLLHNSLKFTGAEGRVYVQAALKGEEVELIVTDTGIGIEHSDLAKIFENFYRGRNTIGEDTAGPGLGLAIVRQLINQCGGKIAVTSQVGKGTIFRIALPVVMSA
ncbi:histidine kinase [Rippkaea orientalis PCC 8801]|uniref:histidine kinase n=1 Tax=Rippkaea orientalis (strain PCC 8801 / RF-1) TaxID=41431 RepID=B7K5X5_RIPO1|nr:DICT sensory domain-containing protein [Rippkaea orientalis]ACK68028.1 histidine kinase [Rippkaea orientalis PCC 8801]